MRKMIQDQINFLQGLLDETEEDEAPQDDVGMVMCLG